MSDALHPIEASHLHARRERVFLVLAGIYFFEYSIEHGLITPAMRMVAGTLVGLGCVLASELRLRRTHTVLANWLAGAGVGILYVAFWAGHSLYGLYPSWASGLLLVGVTGACVTLAVRRDSMAIAVLGLLGVGAVRLWRNAETPDRDEPTSVTTSSDPTPEREAPSPVEPPSGADIPADLEAPGGGRVEVESTGARRRRGARADPPTEPAAPEVADRGTSDEPAASTDEPTDPDEADTGDAPDIVGAEAFGLGAAP